MSDPNRPDDVTSTSGAADSNAPAKVPNLLDTWRPGVQTRQQSAGNAMADADTAAVQAPTAVQATPTLAPAAIQGVQSVTATIDYHSLATAMSCLNDESASNLDKGPS